MTDLLIAFVIPILVIIISAILQTIIKCSYKVAVIAFVLLIIVALLFGGTILYFALAWIYTILAFIIASVIGRCTGNRCRFCCRNNIEDDENISDNDNDNVIRCNRHWTE